MDKKLAVGLVRQGLRKTETLDQRVASVAKQAWSQHAAALAVKGRTSRATSRKTASSISEVNRGAVFTKRLSGAEMSGLVAGEFHKQDGYIANRRESALGYWLSYNANSRRTIEYRSREGGIVVRQHAMTRFLERTAKSYDDLIRELADGVLLTSAYKHLPNVAVRPIVLAAPSGLYLGHCTPNGSDFGLTYQTALVYDDDLVHEQRWLLDPRPVQLVLNTFVSHREMSDSQAAIWKAVTDLVQRHKAALLHWHIRDLVTLGGHRDVFDFVRSEPSLARFHQDFQRILNTATWDDAVRPERCKRAWAGWVLIDRYTTHYGAKTSPVALLNAVYGLTTPSDASADGARLARNAS